MNIGIDIDDTIVNTYDIFLKLLVMKYKFNYNQLLIEKSNYFELYEKLDNFDNVKKDLFSILGKSVKLKENVVNVFNKLKEDGHKIILITARNYNDYDEPYKLTYEYLKKNGVPFDKLIVNTDKKAQVCLDEKIDLFIDDSTMNCKDVSSVGIKTLQFGALFNEEIKDFKKVYSWDEIYEYINCL